MLLDVLGVDQRDDGVQSDLVEDRVVHEEGLRYRHRIGETAGLNEDVIEAVTTAHQLADHVEQIAADGRDAADAAVDHLVYLLIGGDHQLRVDADLAELVLDDGDALAVVLAQYVVEQSRLPGPEEPGQDGDRQPAVLPTGCILGHLAAGGHLLV